MRGFSKLDKVLLLLCLLGGSLALGFLFFQFGMDPERENYEDEIAVVSKLINSGKVQAHDDLTFYPVSKKDKLYNKDKVFSGENSYMNIGLYSGGTIKLSPNSLVVLEKKADSAKLELSKGFFFGHLNEGEKLGVQTKSGHLNLVGSKDSDFEVNSTEAGVEVRVLKGQVEVQTKTGTQALIKNQKIDLLLSGEVSPVQDIEIELVSPENGFLAWKQQSESIELSWRVTDAIESAGFEVLISRDKNFKEDVRKFETQSLSQVAENLGFGSFYWRVQSQKPGKLVQSGLRVLTILEEKPLELAYPANEALLPIEAEATENQRSVFFKVREQIPESRYQLQIAKDLEFQEISRDLEFRGEEVEVKNIGLGEYAWRARILDESRPNTNWSEIRSFSVKKELASLTAPEISDLNSPVMIPNIEYPKSLYGEARGRVSNYLINEAKVQRRFSWDQQDSEHEGSYEIEITRRTKKEPQTLTLKSSSYKIKEIYPNQPISLRVRKLRGDERGPWSELVTLKHELEPARSLSEIELNEVSDGLITKGSVTLKWTPLLYAKAYEIKIGRDSELKKAKSFFTKKPKYPFMIYFDKDYFWQVRAVDKNLEPISKYSKKFPVRIHRVEPAPVAELEGDRSLASIDDSDEPMTTSISPKIETPKKPYKIWGKYWAQVGSGMNYVRYDQTGRDFATLNFQSLKGPTLYLDAGAYITEHIGVEATYKNTTGEFTNSSKGQSGTLQYNWQTYTAEALYKNSAGSGLGFKHTQLVWRGGLQRHLAPFVSATDLADAFVDVSENDLLMGHLGFSYFFTNSQKLRYELMLRYQHPLSAKLKGVNGYSLDPKFAFDGSIGLTYRFYNNFNLGAHWYGQWHSFDYQFENGANSVSGAQSLFFSNIDLRLGLEF